MEINLLAGFAAARELPVGQGLQSHNVDGFVVYLVSDHNDDDTFTLAIRALFAPPDAPDGGMIHWHGLTVNHALRIITATIQFSERHFGESALDDIDRELIADVEKYLGN